MTKLFFYSLKKLEYQGKSDVTKLNIVYTKNIKNMYYICSDFNLYKQ